MDGPDHRVPARSATSGTARGDLLAELDRIAAAHRDSEEDNQVLVPPRRIAVVGSYTIVTFRGWLLEDMVAQDHTVLACAPDLGNSTASYWSEGGRGERASR